MVGRDRGGLQDAAPMLRVDLGQMLIEQAIVLLVVEYLILRQPS